MELLKSVERKFKALVFWIFKWIFITSDTDKKFIDGNNISKILFIRIENKLGDLVITFPLFDEFKKRFPNLKISLLTSPICFPLVKDDPRFSHVHVYRKNVFKYLFNIWLIRKQKYDCVIDLYCDDSITTLFLTQLCAGRKLKIGLGKNEHLRFYDFNYDYSKFNDTELGHIIENTLKVLLAFNIQIEDVDRFRPPFISSEDSDFSEKFMNEIDYNDQKDFIVGYNLSAGKHTRYWQQEKNKELIDKILNRFSRCRILIFSTLSDRKKALDLKKYFNERVDIIPEGINIIKASAILHKMVFLISPDTSLIHIARSFRIPVIGLYLNIRPTDRNYKLWFPYNQKNSIIYSNHNENIYDISVQEVFDKFIDIFEKLGYSK